MMTFFLFLNLSRSCCILHLRYCIIYSTTFSWCIYSNSTSFDLFDDDIAEIKWWIFDGSKIPFNVVIIISCHDVRKVWYIRKLIRRLCCIVCKNKEEWKNQNSLLLKKDIISASWSYSTTWLFILQVSIASVYIIFINDGFFTLLDGMFV